MLKKVIFYRQPSKQFSVFQISLCQLIFTDFLLLKNFLTGKTSSHVLKNTLSRHILYLKGQGSLQNLTANFIQKLMFTLDVNVYVRFY